MITHDLRWSLPRGNTPVPSRWQATPSHQPWKSLGRTAIARLSPQSPPGADSVSCSGPLTDTDLSLSS
jgi:hypothetical protein